MGIFGFENMLLGISLWIIPLKVNKERKVILHTVLTTS